MRNIITLLSILLTCLTSAISAFASGNGPMIREDRVWEYYKNIRYGTDGHEYSGILYYRFDGVEQRYGKEYHRCMLDKATVWENTIIGAKSIETIEVNKCVGLLREEGSKVYILLEGDEVKVCNHPYDRIDVCPVEPGEEAVLFDFGVSDGNTSNLYMTNFYGECMISEAEAYGCGIDNAGYRTFSLRNLPADTPNSSPDDVYGWEITISADVAEGIGNIGGGDMIRYGGTRVDEIDGMPGDDNGQSSDWKDRLINEYLPGHWGNAGSFNNYCDLDGNVLLKGLGERVPAGHSLLRAGKEWVWTGVNVIENTEFEVHYTVLWKEEIDGKDFYRVEQTSEEPSFNGGSYLLCEEVRKVDIRFENEHGDVMILPLFDFSLGVGDSAQVYKYVEGCLCEPDADNRWEVTAEDDITLYGVTRRRMHLENSRVPDNKHKTIWVEGVGGPNFGSQLTQFYFDQPTNGIMLSEFKECRMGDEVIFTLADFNMDSSVECMTDAECKSEADAVIYDVMGRRVVSTVPGSVYIRDGKKFVAR